MAIYDLYKYFNNVEIDVSLINEKYGIVYSNIQPKKFLLKNLFALINLDDFSDYDRYFDDYIIGDNERPDQIAYKLYEDINLWWLNLTINKISYFDFPISDENIYTLAGILYNTEYKYTLDKYISILKEYNDERRFIKVVKPEYINIILTNIFDKFIS